MTVDEIDLLTALDGGEADGDLSDNCHVTAVVTAKAVIAPASLELKANGKQNAALGAKATPKDATEVAPIYEPGNLAIATVDAFEKQRGCTLKKAAFSLLSGAV